MSPIKNKPRRLILSRETLRAASNSNTSIVQRPASDGGTCGEMICSCFSDCGGTYGGTY